MFIRGPDSTEYSFESSVVLITGAAGKSGLSAANLLLRMGAEVILSDSNPDKIDIDSLQNSVRANRVRIEYSKPEDFVQRNEVNCIVTAPGVPLKLPVFELARKRKIPVYGELDLAAGFIQTHYPTFSIAVTGTDGKSTTVQLIAEMIGNSMFMPDKTRARVALCGNIGTPVSDIAVSMIDGKHYDILVIECSSFQLEPVFFFRPNEAAVLNLAEDHLNRYESMHQYGLAKLNIARNQTEEDQFYINKNYYIKNYTESVDFIFRAIVHEIDPGHIPERISFAGQYNYNLQNFALAGPHNRSNLFFAANILNSVLNRLQARIDFEALQDCLDHFKSLPHRLEFVTEKDGILFVNDSKATTVQSMLVAIGAYPAHKIFLLAGGLDKGSDFSILNSKLTGEQIFAYGKAASTIQKVTGCYVFENLEQAFHSASESARKYVLSSNRRAVVLLSPACASQDQYENYQQRGEHFKQLCSE